MKQKRKVCNIGDYIARFFMFLFGGIIGLLQPTIPFALVCVFAIFLDSISAWRLAKRLKKKYKHVPSHLIHDKYESGKAFAMFNTLLIVYGVIVLGYCIDTIMFPFLDMKLPNFLSGAFCLYEILSILENESSENNQSWAKFLQKFLVNKASRHIEDFYESWHGLDSKYGHGNHEEEPFGDAEFEGRYDEDVHEG